MARCLEHCVRDRISSRMSALPEFCPAAGRLPGDWGAVETVRALHPPRPRFCWCRGSRWILHTCHVDRVEREWFAFLKKEGLPSLSSAFCMQATAQWFTTYRATQCWIWELLSALPRGHFQAPLFKTPPFWASVLSVVLVLTGHLLVGALWKQGFALFSHPSLSVLRALPPLVAYRKDLSGLSGI